MLGVSGIATPTDKNIFGERKHRKILLGLKWSTSPCRQPLRGINGHQAKILQYVVLSIAIY